MAGRPVRADPLSVGAIVAVALRLAARDGLEAVRMRDVAAELDVAAGALYWHVSSQRALQVAVVEAVLGAVPSPSELRGTPRERITRHIRLLQRALVDNPGITGAVIANAPDTPLGAKLRDGVRAALREAGLSHPAAHRAFLALEWLWLGSRTGTGPHAYDQETFDAALTALLDGILGTAPGAPDEGAYR
ncbi:TetR/AcrR family transcriptional regulator [Frankia canadensis]|nr:TetR family transcriptional regulator [Frankia canadensis]